MAQLKGVYTRIAHAQRHSYDTAYQLLKAAKDLTTDPKTVDGRINGRVKKSKKNLLEI